MDQLFASTGQLFDLRTFSGRSLIIPQQSRADDVSGLIKKHTAMHLTAEPDSADIGRFQLGRLHHLFHGINRRCPPVTRSLLRPARLGIAQWVFFHRRSQDLALFVDGQSLCTAGSDIDAKEDGHEELLQE